VRHRKFLAGSLLLLATWGSYRAAMRAWAGHLVQYDPTVANLQFAATILPENPTIHRLLGRNYLDNPNLANPQLAETMLQQAVKLAPQRYQNWLLYARAQETAGNLAAAEQSLQRALKLAPQYYDCYWQYAHFLARNARPQEAIRQLRLALTRDITQLDYALDFGWQLTGGDLKLVESLLPVASNPRANNPSNQQHPQPDHLDPDLATSEARTAINQLTDKDLTVARSYLEFLLRQKLYLPAVERLRPELVADERYLLQIKELINQLINAQQYAAAYYCWQQLPAATATHLTEATTPKSNAPALPSPTTPPSIFYPTIHNGDFREPLVAGQPQFNWQFKSTPTAKLSVDRPADNAAGRSLKIDYNIEQNEGITHLEQLILVAPRQQYQLQYRVKSEDLRGGSMPVVEVRDPQGNLLARSQPAISATTDWKTYQLQFFSPPINAKVSPNSQALDKFQRPPRANSAHPSNKQLIAVSSNFKGTKNIDPNAVKADLTAVYLRVQRDGQCRVPGPCPIAGQVWFGDFKLLTD
jgi:tetratricopeptide (TPR) repeat protein